MLWDVRAQKQLRKMDGHTDRVGALSWNRHLLSSAMIVQPNSVC